MAEEWIWCVACGATLQPNSEGDYLYCMDCFDGPFCGRCFDEHECEEDEDDARD
jgi:hypothetical protein